MNDRMLVEALASGDPAALDFLYDAHAERLYAYCWFLVRRHDIAHVALRDALIVARARIAELPEPGRLRPWLYALARNECHRRDTSTVSKPDIAVATPDQEDADLRVLAWHAVAGLPPVSRELLELRIRHELPAGELADVLGLSAKEVQAQLDQADSLLERVLVAEILAQRGPYDCAARGLILRDRRGELTDPLRDRLLWHTRDCAECAAHRPRNVSAAKVYELLPYAIPPQTVRIKVMSCFADPELAGYRDYAARRAGTFGDNGFPRRDERSGRLGPFTSGRWMLGLAAGVIAIALAGAGMRWAGEVTVELPDAGAPPAAGRLGAGGAPVAGPDATPVDADGDPASATFPLGARTPAVPPTALSVSPPEPSPAGPPGRGGGWPGTPPRGRSGPPPGNPGGGARPVRPTPGDPVPGKPPTVSPGPVRPTARPTSRPPTGPPSSPASPRPTGSPSPTGTSDPPPTTRSPSTASDVPGRGSTPMGAGPGDGSGGRPDPTARVSGAEPAGQPGPAGPNGPADRSRPADGGSGATVPAPASRPGDSGE